MRGRGEGGVGIRPRVDQGAVERELAAQRVDLLEGAGRGGAPLEVAAEEAVRRHPRLQCEMGRVLVRENRPQLFLAQPPSMSEHGGHKDIDKTVHVRLHARVEVPQRMMQAGGELQGHLRIAAGGELGFHVNRYFK